MKSGKQFATLILEEEYRQRWADLCELRHSPPHILQEFLSSNTGRLLLSLSQPYIGCLARYGTGVLFFTIPWHHLKHYKIVVSSATLD